MYKTANSTPIDQLYEQENQNRNNPSINKFIRGGGNQMPNQSGMNPYPTYNGPSDMGPSDMGPSNMGDNDNIQQQKMRIQQHILAHSQPSNQLSSGPVPIVRESFGKSIPQHSNPNPNFSCLDVCKHIEKCPMCSKFFDTDKTIYVILVVLLLIIIGFLVKKLIDKQ
jgi:hypothetical protein